MYHWHKIINKVQFQTELARLTLALQYSILCVMVNILKKRVHFKVIHAANAMSVDSSYTTQHLNSF